MAMSDIQCIHNDSCIVSGNCRFLPLSHGTLNSSDLRFGQASLNINKSFRFIHTCLPAWWANAFIHCRKSPLRSFSSSPVIGNSIGTVNDFPSIFPFPSIRTFSDVTPLTLNDMIIDIQEKNIGLLHKPHKEIVKNVVRECTATVFEGL